MKQEIHSIILLYWRALSIFQVYIITVLVILTGNYYQNNPDQSTLLSGSIFIYIILLPATVNIINSKALDGRFLSLSAITLPNALISRNTALLCILMPMQLLDLSIMLISGNTIGLEITFFVIKTINWSLSFLAITNIWSTFPKQNANNSPFQLKILSAILAFGISVFLERRLTAANPFMGLLFCTALFSSSLSLSKKQYYKYYQIITGVPYEKT